MLNEYPKKYLKKNYTHTRIHSAVEANECDDDSFPNVRQCHKNSKGNQTAQNI